MVDRSADDWDAVRDLFVRALAVAEPERARFVNDRTTDAPGLRREVLSLLESLGASATIEPPTRPPAPAPARRDERVGPYRLVDPIGSGGMGSVWRARRDDGAFDRDVAVKFVRLAIADAANLRRFERERRLLAGLEHEGIARLLDGGRTADGEPYLVMELVDGAPLDRHLAAGELPEDERLELFARVVDSVAYAHERGVVHLDLKPRNVLVAADGRPKLLDFGVARAVGDAGPEATSSAPALTPRYASPEQFRGDAVSPASDVYALGVLLHEILTGQPPYPGPPATLRELERAVCDESPHVLVPGPLGSIVDQALRKAPRARYSSARELKDDLERFRRHERVVAHRESPLARAARFVRRHRGPVVAAAIVVATLAVALAITVDRNHEARRANERAEARARNLRELAGEMVFDLHPLLPDVAGTTRAREFVVTRGLRWLEGLAEDAARDPSLWRAVGEAAVQLARLQWDGPQALSLGRPDDAAVSARRAVDAFDRALARDPGDAEARLGRARAERLLAEVALAKGDLDAARRRLAASGAAARELVGDDVLGVEARRERLRGLWAEANVAARERRTADERALLDAAEREGLVPPDVEGTSVEDLSLRLTHLAGRSAILWKLGRLEEALAAQRRQQDLAARLRELAPGETWAESAAARADLDGVRILGALRRFDEAIAAADAAIARHRSLRARDPVAFGPLDNLILALQEKAGAERRKGDVAGARATYEEALARTEEGRERWPEEHGLASRAGSYRGILAELAIGEHDLARAEPYVRGMIDDLEWLLERDRSRLAARENLLDARGLLCFVVRERGDFDAGLALAEKLVAEAEATLATDGEHAFVRVHRLSSEFMLAQALDRLATDATRPEEARRAWARRAVAAYDAHEERRAALLDAGVALPPWLTPPEQVAEFRARCLVVAGSDDEPPAAEEEERSAERR